MRKVTTVLLLAGALTGCAGTTGEQSPWLVQRDLNPPKRCEPLTADQELVLGLSQEMASAGRHHAALANLERLPDELPQVRLSKARLLRLLGHGSEAEALYGSLLGSCLVADAHHGLGQIDATRRNYPSAQQHLRAAASLSPANESIRNDLGVVYMNQRQLAEARFELLTAMELNENSRRAAQNLLTLLVYEGNWQGARELVNARGLSSDDFKRAEQRARTMRNNDANAQAPALAGQPLATAQPAGIAQVTAPAATDPGVRSATTAPAAAPAPVSGSAQGLARANVAAPDSAAAQRVAGAEHLAKAAVPPLKPSRIPLAAAAQWPAPAADAAPASAATQAPARAPTAVPVSAAVQWPAAAQTAAPARSVTPMPLAVAAQAWATEEAGVAAGAANPVRGVQQTPSTGARPIVCRSSEANASRPSVMECHPE